MAEASSIWIRWAHSVWGYLDRRVWDCEIEIGIEDGVPAIAVAPFLSQGLDFEHCKTISATVLS